MTHLSYGHYIQTHVCIYTYIPTHQIKTSKLILNQGKQNQENFIYDMGISQDTIFNKKDGIFVQESNKGNIFVNFLVVTSDKINYNLT